MLLKLSSLLYLLNVLGTTHTADCLSPSVWCVSYVGVCAGLCICVMEPHISALYYVCVFAAADGFLCHIAFMTPSPKLSRSRLCGSRGTTAVTHHVLPFGTATGGAPVCASVRAVFPIGTNTKSQERCKDAAHGAGRHKPTLISSGFQKQPRSHGCNNSGGTSSSVAAPEFQTLGFVAATVLLCPYRVLQKARKYFVLPATQVMKK